MPKLNDSLVQSSERSTCAWVGEQEDYRAYHDDEWGRPVADDARLFEKLSLEAFQSGLSWLTILRKRESFRCAFECFDFRAVARFDATRVERLMRDTGIVRHRGKIEATIRNARCVCDLVDEYACLAAYFWRFEPEPGERPERFDQATLRSLTATPQSRALAKDLKRRGFSFLGPTTCYAFMQAAGLVNDHEETCHARPAVERARLAFRPR